MCKQDAGKLAMLNHHLHELELYGGFLKWGYPPNHPFFDIFCRVFHYKPSILWDTSIGKSASHPREKIRKTPARHGPLRGGGPRGSKRSTEDRRDSLGHPSISTVSWPGQEADGWLTTCDNCFLGLNCFCFGFEMFRTWFTYVQIWRFPQIGYP